VGTSRTYQVTTADEGYTLACEETATSDEGTASALSNEVHVLGQAPRDVSQPRISGTPRYGQTLTCLHGTWEGVPTPTFAYRWLRGNEVIPGAAAETHLVERADEGRRLLCEVTATNSAGSESARSTSVEIESEGLPRNTKLPSVRGELAAGKTVECSAGTWENDPTAYEYQWYLASGGEAEAIATPIEGATAQTYVIASYDRGGSLSCTVTASNSAGEETATSESVRIPGIKPENTEAPAVIGSPVSGETLTCQRGKWKGNPPPVFKYEWLRDGTVITALSTTSTYVTGTEDRQHQLSCKVVATNSEGSAEALSANAVEVTATGVKSSGKSSEQEYPQPTHYVSHTPTQAQIRAAMSRQLTKAAKRMRITSLQRHGGYSFSFTAPTAGTLEVSCYEVPKGAHKALKKKSLLVATATTTFGSAKAKTVKIRLTSVGRRLFAQSIHVKLALQGNFVLPPGLTVSWLKTFVLSA
jgi:O-acetyl-ADP-ribose deacetylase (regulator of RNase III)